MDESKYLLTAYQKKALDLFNQSISSDAKQQHLIDLVEAYKAKVDELVNINQELSKQIDVLNVHISEREEQIKNITKKQSNRTSGRKSQSTVKSDEVKDGGSF